MKNTREVANAVAVAMMEAIRRTAEESVVKPFCLAPMPRVVVTLRNGAEIYCTSASWVQLANELVGRSALYIGRDMVAAVRPSAVKSVRSDP